jgi:thioredoxin-related protein
MKKYLSILTLLFGAFSAKAQHPGIQFDQYISWQQVKEKAKATHKYIFIDCISTSSPACTFMNTNVFSQQEVGNAVNENFISIAVQMDTAAKDDSLIKSWYRDANQLKKQYQITAFPTYLFFDPNGQIVHQDGGILSPKEFIDAAAKALDPNKQFYSLMQKYQNGTADSAVVKELAVRSFHFGNYELSSTLVHAYISSIKHIYDKSNLQFFRDVTNSSKDTGFYLWLRHPDEVDQVMGKDYSHREVMNIIMNEDQSVIDANKKAVVGYKLLGNLVTSVIAPAYGTDIDKNIKEPVPPEWDKMYAGIKERYGAYYADRITKWVKMTYYEHRQNWPAYEEAVTAYVEQYFSTIKTVQMNDFCWNIFLHSEDKNYLNKAASWIKAVITQIGNDARLGYYIDTYANLLYKLDDKTQSILWEQKAVQSNPDEKIFAETLDKMNKGVKTW